MNRVWDQHIKRLRSKMKHWEEIQGKINKCPDQVEGIPISDELLKDKYGDMDNKVLVYGGIIPTENMIAFLKLPSKLKLFGKMDRLREEVRGEAEATKARWDERER